MARTAPRVSVVSLARPTFDLEHARAKDAAARALLADMGAEVLAPTGLIMTPEDTAAATPLPDADLYILLMASFSDSSPAMALLGEVPGPVLLWSFREPGAVGERLLLNSMCGANLAAHALRTLGQSARHLHGNPDEPAVRTALAAALAGQLPPDTAPTPVHGVLADEVEVASALASLRGRRLGAIGDAPNGFTPCVYDADQLARVFGLTVVPITIAETFARVAAVPAEKRDLAHAAAVAAQPSLASVNDSDARTVASVEVVLDEWRAGSDLDAIAIRCWPEFATDLGACPCSALGRLQDRGTVMTCERDVLGAVTMLVTEALGSGPTYLVDIVDQVPDDGLIRVWHCGSAATKLAADPEDATQYIHCNRRLGVAGNFPLKTGPVTMVRIDRDAAPDNPSGLRMVLTSGESIPAPNHFQGNTATVRTTAPADLLVNGIVTRGFPHHLVLAWADVKPELRRAAALLGIPLTEW